MTSRENRGGILKNSQVEKDNRVRGKAMDHGQYEGAQDTGDRGKREKGTIVQQRDGLPPENMTSRED